MTICQMDSILFMQATTPVLASTMLDAPSGPNLDLFCVKQSGAAPFVKIMQSFLMQKGLNRGWRNFWFPFFEKNAHFDRY